MIYALIIISALLQVHTTDCWGSSKSNVAGDNKQDVNFSGKLTTQQGQEYVVNNISIESKYRQIIMYDTPVKHADVVMNAETKQSEIKLDVNPSDLSDVQIDLSEVNKIRIPHPNTVWVYQKKERSQRLEFIEVLVTTSKERSYLMERRTKIYCDEIDAAGPQEKRVPLAALDTLTIDGYSAKINVSGDNKKCVQTVCPAEKK